MSKPCQLSQCLNLKDFESVLSTLKVEADRFAPNESFFSCCEGEGLSFRDEGKGLLRCDLKRRFRLLKELVLLIAELYPDQDPIEVLRLSAKKWEERKYDLSSFSGKTRALIDIKKYDEISPCWSAVFRWQWQLGYQVEKISFTEAAKRSVAMTEELLHMEGERLLFIYGIDHLWDQLYVDTLEYLINFAEQGRFQLFLLFQPVSDRQEMPDNRRSKYFRHIRQLKTNDPLTFLTPHMRSRLQTMCKDHRLISKENVDRESLEFDIGF